MWGWTFRIKELQSAEGSFPDDSRLIFRFYNDREDCENRIQKFKNGFDSTASVFTVKVEIGNSG
jgi:hypothetical protein